MAKLTKSLAELDAVADELLAKSKAAEDNQDEAKDEETVAPKDISEDSESEDAEADTEEDNEEYNSEEEVKKSKSMKKSDNVDDFSEDEEVKKSEDEDEEEDENSEENNSEDEEVKKSEDEDEEEDEMEKSCEDVKKSIQEDFESDESIKKGMIDSEFNAAIVEVISKSLGDMQYDVQHQSRNQEAANEVLAKSLNAVLQANSALRSDNEKLIRRVNKLEKSISRGIDRIMDSLDEMSTEPAHMRKSMASISVHDRDFDRSLNGQQTVGGFESLSKSQVLEVLNNELYAGNQNVTPQDIISYESGAPLRPNLQSLVASKCK